MKLKSAGKLLVFLGAATALAVSLINDKKSNNETDNNENTVENE